VIHATARPSRCVLRATAAAWCINAFFRWVVSAACLAGANLFLTPDSPPPTSTRNHTPEKQQQDCLRRARAGAHARRRHAGRSAGRHRG
jgi:hypothetical protein